MKLFLHYLKSYKWLIMLALLLATINQLFSLMDPYIFGKIIDRFASHPQSEKIDGATVPRWNLTVS